MKCLRCSAEIPPQSKFCLRCGTPVNATTEIPAFSSPSAPLRGGAPGGSGKGVWIALGVVALIALGLGALVVKGQLTQKAGETSTGTLVQAPGEASTGTLVQKPGETVKTPMVQAPAEGNNAAVIDYLARLREIELTKQRINKDLSNNAMAVIGTATANGLKDAMRAFGNTESQPGDEKPLAANAETKQGEQIGQQSIRDFDTLTRKFNQLQPPQSCAILHSTYYDYLGRLQSQLSKTIDLLNRSLKLNQGDDIDAKQKQLQILYSTLDESKSQVDVYGKKANDYLHDVFGRYNIPSSSQFEIGGDDLGINTKGLTGIN